MRLESLEVTGYGNLSQTVAFAPMDELTVVYGANNCGKSNLVRAIELFYRLLAAGESVSRSQTATLTDDNPTLGGTLARAFHVDDPQPIRFKAAWSLAGDDLEGIGLITEQVHQRLGVAAGQSIRNVGVEFEVQRINRSMEMRVGKWEFDGQDVSTLERGKEQVLVGFASQVRRWLADCEPFRHERPVVNFAFLGTDLSGFPQPVRDRMFDARQSINPDERRRWSLFSQLAGSLRGELGDGTWDTVFDRAKGRADLVYLWGQDAVPLDRMGAGIRRAVCMLAELCLARERFVCIEEPECRLSPDLQTRFIQLARRIIQSGIGPEQLIVTTHSPLIAAHGTPYLLESVDGIPHLQQKPWQVESTASWVLNPGALLGEPQDNAGLEKLIGMIGELAELDPDALLEEVAVGQP